MERKTYPRDLSDSRWAHVALPLPRARPREHIRTANLPKVVDGILYGLREGLARAPPRPHALGHSPGYSLLVSPDPPSA